MPVEKKVSDAELVSIIRSADDPVLTTAEVTEGTPISRQAVKRRLEQLFEEGHISRKKAGRNRVWWVDVDDKHVSREIRDRLIELDRRLTAVEDDIVEQNENTGILSRFGGKDDG